MLGTVSPCSWARGASRGLCAAGGDNEVQRTMLEIVNQLDGFDSRGNIKVTARRLLARHPHDLTWPFQVTDIVTGRWQPLLTLSSCQLSRTTFTTLC